MRHVVIVGGGFVGINAAKLLGKRGRVDVTLIDQRNHHLFQPLLYQVAMAGLDPSEIATPIRRLLSPYRRVRTLLARVSGVDVANRQVITDGGSFRYDYLILACGSKHSYFGNDHWEEHAPGLKTLSQATEIRRRVLVAFERAEIEVDPKQQQKWLTFVVVGGGPTGVELAGAIAELSKHALSRDYRAIRPASARIVIVEGSDRVLGQFDPAHSQYAKESLGTLGVEVMLQRQVTKVDEDGVWIGDDRIEAGTVLWAAGVQASPLAKSLGVPTDRAGRVIVASDLSIPGDGNVFVAGDMAHCVDAHGKPLPGLAPVAMQQGRYLAQLIDREVQAQQNRVSSKREPFRYFDKGQMATIGRRRAVVESGKLKFRGLIAWAAWLLIHIYYLSSFRNRMFVFLQWTYSYLTYSRGARLIVQREWRIRREEKIPVFEGELQPDEPTTV
jgi:NADH:ubiquinone reductase (H+-translocating)